ncbi:hypothetical protein HYH02_012049 [Chlamydomonas schloesseri]|uniref:EamA domain-containing protein n=1 Tax=Chlamydomonas schloesseri TaxID=2026947 RepID=A0A835SXE3_9CHLO|nr:hypothetical protein HYH02_012049 [Chlamydomonas schloesseri]|eukprot:KAG2435052.1 hypothetical protein HYH02_012049 [Chlamydomonas schloesseri]
MPEVPAITLAAWRLQLTSVFLGLGAAGQWRGMSRDDRGRTLGSAAWLAGSGACLAVHFGAWVWGLQHTSLTHSLLMVSATPLLLAALALVLGSPISRGEVGGALLGLAGAVVLSVSATGGREAQAGLAGDLASLLASAVMVGYLSVGRRLRQWMPIFIYAFPVTGSAALALTLGGLALEPVSLLGSGSHGSLGWLTSAHYAPWVLYLALGPGIVGHTGFNTLLRYLSPLTVALAFQMEPLVGSVIGWAAGVMAPPGALTYGGGALVVAATIWVTVASAERERAEEAAKAAAAKQELVPAASWESEEDGGSLGGAGLGKGAQVQGDEEAQQLLGGPGRL